MKILTLAAALSAGILSMPLSPAGAMPLGPTPSSESNVVQIAGGCGPGFFRGPYGGCRRMGFGGPRPFMARACPPGFRLGPYGRRCRPIY